MLLQTIVDACRKIKLKVLPPLPDPFEGMCAPGTHVWRGREEHDQNGHEWVRWCDVCGCMHDPREGD